MTEQENGIKKSRTATIVVVVIVVIAIGTGAGLYLHSKLSAPNTNGKQVITVAAPVYTSSTPAIENFLNESMSGWLKTHPNVEIKFVGPFGASTEGQYYTKLDLMTSSKTTAPDVMLEDMFYTATYANSGTILSLNNYINSSVFSNVDQSGLGQMTINGNHYGIPMQLSDTLIYYNMSLFKEAGIQTPWQPHNWTDIINAAQTLHSKLPNIVPMNVYTGVKADEASAFTGFESLLYGTGWGLYNFTANKWYGENPGLYNTLQFYKTVFVNDSIAQTSLSNTPYVTTGKLMQQGNLGIAIDGSWMYGYQWASGGQNPITNFTHYIGVAAIPTEYGQGQGYTTVVGGWGWSAYSGVSNATLIGSFISALGNTTNQVLANLPGGATPGGLPATKDASSNPLFPKLMPSAPSLDSFYVGLLKYGHFRPPVAGYPKTSYQLQVAMDAVSINGTSVATAMANYNSALQSTFGSSDVQAIPATPAVSTSAAQPSSVPVTQAPAASGNLQQYQPLYFHNVAQVTDSQGLDRLV